MNELNHVAIIMDGNRRWAKRKGLDPVEGHKAGAENVERVMEMMKSAGVHFLTLYAFSTENWKRSAAEVEALMDLLLVFLHEKCEKLKKDKVRLLVSGRLDGMPEKQQNALKEVMAETARDYEYTLILALNYGGRAELADAAKKIARLVKENKLDPECITEETVAENLYNPDVPDPDILIRTGGDMRISNFLLWEISYSEIFVTDTCWPDFSRPEFNSIIESYMKRERRFGGTVK